MWLIGIGFDVEPWWSESGVVVVVLVVLLA